MRIENRVVVVTGAGSGIGAALAHAFAAAGARVVVGDIDGDRADTTAEQIIERGHPAVALRADASNEADIDAMIKLAATEFGPVDVYVANAGVGGPSGLGLPDQEWDRVLDVNVRAHVRAAAMVVPGWLERGRGYFVSMASAAGLLTQIGAAPYAVSKHAAIAFAEWLAIAHGDDGIGVSCVCPMGVNTALLQTAHDSLDVAQRLTATAITHAAEVLQPERIADATVEAVRTDTFLVLPHPQVLDLLRQKTADYGHWISGMKRYQRSLPTNPAGR